MIAFNFTRVVEVECHHCSESASHEEAMIGGEMLSQSELSWLFILDGWVAMSEEYWVCPSCSHHCGMSLSVVKEKNDSSYLIVDADRSVYAHVVYSQEKDDWVYTAARPLAYKQVLEVVDIIKAQAEVVPF